MPAHHRVRRAAGEREPLSAAETPGAGWAVAPTRALCRSEELPDWYEPSRHVLSGYRVGYDACACAGSVSGADTKADTGGRGQRSAWGYCRAGTGQARARVEMRMTRKGAGAMRIWRTRRCRRCKRRR